MATHSSVLAWRIPGTAETGGLPSYGVALSQTRLRWLSSSSSEYILNKYINIHRATFKKISLEKQWQSIYWVWKKNDVTGAVKTEKLNKVWSMLTNKIFKPASYYCTSFSKEKMARLCLVSVCCRNDNELLLQTTNKRIQDILLRQCQANHCLYPRKVYD